MGMDHSTMTKDPLNMVLSIQSTFTVIRTNLDFKCNLIHAINVHYKQPVTVLKVDKSNTKDFTSNLPKSL